jgi:hypothetical protein
MRSGRASADAVPSLREASVVLALALVVVAVAALTFVVRFDRPDRRTSGDTYFYVLQAERFAGYPAPEAERSAKRLVCADIHNGLKLDGRITSSCDSLGVIRSPRYAAIFTSRPLWPLLLAPAVRVLGLLRAAIGLALLGALLAALAVFIVLRALGCSPPAAGSAGVAFSLLPTGYWADKLLPEGAVLAALVAAMFGGARVVQGRLRGLLVLVPALVALYAFKPANGAALSIGLLVAGGLLLPLVKGRARALVLAGTGLAGVVGWFAASSLLRLPSFEDTVQDLATEHFSRPDVSDPLTFLAHENRELWLELLGRWLGVPWPFLIVLPAAVIAVLGLRRAGVVWVAVSITGVSIVVAHPMISQYDRLVSSIWLAVVAAVAVIVDAAARLPRVPSRRSSRPPVRQAGDTVPMV